MKITLIKWSVCFAAAALFLFWYHYDTTKVTYYDVSALEAYANDDVTFFVRGATNLSPELIALDVAVETPSIVGECDNFVSGHLIFPYKNYALLWLSTDTGFAYRLRTFPASKYNGFFAEEDGGYRKHTVLAYFDRTKLSTEGQYTLALSVKDTNQKEYIVYAAEEDNRFVR